MSRWARPWAMLLLLAAAAATFAVADAHSMSYPSVVVSLDDIELSATGEADPVARPHGVASRDLADDEVSGTAAASVESDCPPGTTATACERMKARRVTANAEHKIARRATRVAQTASARVARPARARITTSRPPRASRSATPRACSSDRSSARRCAPPR